MKAWCSLVNSLIIPDCACTCGKEEGDGNSLAKLDRFRWKKLSHVEISVWPIRLQACGNGILRNIRNPIEGNNDASPLLSTELEQLRWKLDIWAMHPSKTQRGKHRDLKHCSFGHGTSSGKANKDIVVLHWYFLSCAQKGIPKFLNNQGESYLYGGIFISSHDGRYVIYMNAGVDVWLLHSQFDKSCQMPLFPCDYITRDNGNMHAQSGKTGLVHETRPDTRVRI